MKSHTAHELQKRGLLSRMDLFEDMTHEDVEAISQKLKMDTIPKDCVIYHGGTEDLYLLKQGRVKLLRLTYEGDETVIGHVEAGHMFGMTALLGQVRGNDVAVAMEECIVCRTSISAFFTILSRHPRMMARMMIALAKRIFVLETTVEDLVVSPVRTRVAKQLLRACANSGDHEVTALRGLTRQALADEAMTTRESVSRCIHELAELGAVGFQGRTIVILDRTLLSDIVRQGERE